jgi:pimeloyl-ACP methyl ester carboxylesterase
LAYQLEGAPVWDTELGSFLSALLPPAPEGLIMLHPYRPGRVPVVLIHGTASSPARWADIINELRNDPKLRERIDFWLFTYNTSNPILLSASELRSSLRRFVQELDPLGRDPVLHQLVLVGHSQGGLLTRLMVTDSGTRAWEALPDVPFDQVDVSPDTRALLKQMLFFEPLPFVTRVVFIATPHRGSFRVSSFVLSVLRRLISLPFTVVKGARELAERNPGLSMIERSPNAVDGMRPGSPLVRTLPTMPIDQVVTAHSIIPIRGDPPAAGQNDGVVTYESAHLDGVASEKIISRSEHSTQSNPATILELRRILYEHLGISCGLECEVPARVEAAGLSIPKVENTAPKMEGTQGP